MRDYQRIRDKQEGVHVFISECRKACLHLLARCISREEFEPRIAHCFIGGLNRYRTRSIVGIVKTDDASCSWHQLRKQREALAGDLS